MLEKESLDRSELLALTPLRYLGDGFRDETGQLRPELQGVFATAAATQLEEAEASPQELAATLEAFRQALPLHRAKPRKRFSAAVAEALETVAIMYSKPNNRGIVTWLELCATAVRTEDDIAAFVEHFTAVVRQYGVIIALKEVSLRRYSFSFQ